MICISCESPRHFLSNATNPSYPSLYRVPRYHQKSDSGTPSKGSVIEQDHQVPRPAQPSEARPHNMHIEWKLSPVARDYLRLATLLAARVMEKKAFLVPWSPNLDFSSLVGSAHPRRAIAPHWVVPDPNKYMFSESPGIELSIGSGAKWTTDVDPKPFEAILNPNRPANQRRAAVHESADAISTLIGRLPNCYEACEMNGRCWLDDDKSERSGSASLPSSLSWR